MLSPESTAHILASTPIFLADQTSNSPARSVDKVISEESLVSTSRTCLGEAQAVWFLALCLHSTVVLLLCTPSEVHVRFA